MDMKILILKSALTLGGILFCLYGLMYLMKKLSNSKQGMFGSSGVIDIMGSRNINQKASLSVIKVGDKYLLLGVTDSQVSLITELDHVPEDFPVSREWKGMLKRVPGGGTQSLKSLLTSLWALQQGKKQDLSCGDSMVKNG